MTFDLFFALTRVAAPVMGKHIGMAAADSLTLGGASAIKNGIAELKNLADQSNENLFYWQLKTFLDTASEDISEEEVTTFLNNHPHGYRFGAEIFKILESTYLEKQAELIGIAFKQRVKGKITESQFNQYVHIITQLNHHIIETLNMDLIGVRDYALHKLPRENDEASRIGFLSHGVSNGRYNGYSCHSLEILGFIMEDFERQNRQTSALAEKSFKRTGLYLSFYLDIYKDQIPTV
jgi:hypothetical protein